MSAAKRRHFDESCSSLTPCQLRQCAQASDWTRAAQLVEDLDGCRGCVQFVALKAVQDQQWDLVLQLIERGVPGHLRNSLLQSALDHRHVLCTARLMYLGVSKHCREEGICHEIASGHGDFILEVARKVRDPELTDFVLRESMKESQWQLVSDLVKEGLNVAQMECVCHQAVADQQWTVALQLLRDGVSASEWMVSELFQNNKAQDLLDLFPAGSVPEGLKGLLLMASVRHGLGDLSLHILQRETVSDSELMEAIKYAVHRLDKTIFLKLIRECPKGRRVFKQKFIHQDWKESPVNDGSDGHKVFWLYSTLYKEGEKDLALHVAASILNFNLLCHFCMDEIDHFDFDLRKKRYRYALRKLHEDDPNDFYECVKELYEMPKTSKSDRSFLFCSAIRLGELGFALELCKHGVSRRDLKFATSWLLEKADDSMFDSLLYKLDNKQQRDWLKQYAVRVTMKEYFKLNTDASLKVFMKQFESCYDEMFSSNIFKKAVEKSVRNNRPDCFVALFKKRFQSFGMKRRRSLPEEDYIFAYTCAVDGKRFDFILKVCEERFVKEVALNKSEMVHLLDIIIEKEALDILPGLFSILKKGYYLQGNLCEILKKCLHKMLSNQSTWLGIAPTLDQLIRGTDRDLMDVSREFADVLEQWSVSMSSLKQWCLDNGHPHLAFFLAVVTEDWKMVEVVVNTQAMLDLKASLLEQSVVMAAKKGVFSACTAVLKVTPMRVEGESISSQLRPQKIHVPLAKACEDEGLLDWALLLQSNNVAYVLEHHRHCHNPDLLNCILRHAADGRKWDLTRELIPRCADSSSLHFVLMIAVDEGKADIVAALIDCVDTSVVEDDIMCNKTLLFVVVESSFKEQVKVDLVRQLIAAGHSTFQRVIRFGFYNYRTNHNCPLLRAIGNLPLVKLLLACGAINYRRLHKIRQDREMQRWLNSRGMDEDWKMSYRYALEAAATPCRLMHMARLVVSHSIGCGPGHSERIDGLPVPEPIKDLVRFKDVLSMDVSVPEPAEPGENPTVFQDAFDSDSDSSFNSSSGSDSEYDSFEDIWM